MQINITLLKMLSIYSFALYSSTFLLTFWQISKCVLSRAKLAHSLLSGLKFQGRVFEVEKKFYAGQLQWPLSSKLNDFPNSDKLAWVVPFGSGFAVHVLSVQNHRAGAPGQEVYTSSHISVFPLPHSDDCPSIKIPPCKLGGVELYSQASKFKVCVTLLVCRYWSRKRNLFSMQLRILKR